MDGWDGWSVCPGVDGFVVEVGGGVFVVFAGDEVEDSLEFHGGDGVGVGKGLVDYCVGDVDGGFGAVHGGGYLLEGCGVGLGLIVS